MEKAVYPQKKEVTVMEEMQSRRPLPRSFYLQNGLALAQALLGKILVRRTPEGITAGRIVETEAYLGKEDPAAHSYKGNTRRTRIQFGPGGYAYVYLIYGMHCCMNVVAGPKGTPHVVLLRALEPVAGLEQMALRRKTKRVKDFCNGPGKLCQAMAIDRSCYGLDLLGQELWVEDGPALSSGQILFSKRIHIDYAGEAANWPYRFCLKGSPYLSAPAEN